MPIDDNAADENGGKRNVKVGELGAQGTGRGDKGGSNQHKEEDNKLEE